MLLTYVLALVCHDVLFRGFGLSSALVSYHYWATVRLEFFRVVGVYRRASITELLRPFGSRTTVGIGTTAEKQTVVLRFRLCGWRQIRGALSLHIL